MEYGGIIFSGKSGEKYFFQVWPMETRFKSLSAVFFITKCGYTSGTYRRIQHEGIYIGQTENLADPLQCQLQLPCFQKHGANRICIHLDSNNERRLIIEQDLIASQNPPCNNL